WHRLTFDPSGRRRVLRRRPNGDCTFLGPSGCVLDEETRPLVCRLYPHAYTERGLDGESDHYCPTERLRSPDDPNATMLTILRMEPEAARRWHRMLYAELHADGELSSCTSA
ncbi:MAG: YkgJ family cysteine cluster protein, partial [Phycisphaerales bacterium]|nr:YkgJ family cysteine cluster protein [Phycisphaerales bacterium]